MNNSRRYAVAALVTAGLLWGTTVPLSKLALEWLAPGWLTVVRFGLAAAVLLAVGRPGLRAAFTPKILASGALGYGGSVVVQNAGIARTSVTHAALLIGAVPVLVAVIAALWHHSVARPVAWIGFVTSLGGVGLITGRGGRPGLHPGHGGRAGHPGRPRPGRGRRRADGVRHAGALHPVRLRAEPGVRRGRRGVPQPRAAGRRHRGRRPLRQPARPGTGRRRRGHRGGHRPE